jgi:hypothetical protein
MAKVKIINDWETRPSPTEGKLYITEDDRIIMGVQLNHTIKGVYLDTGRLITIHVSFVSPVPSTWKIELSNE